MMSICHFSRQDTDMRYWSLCSQLSGHFLIHQSCCDSLELPYCFCIPSVRLRSISLQIAIIIQNTTTYETLKSAYNTLYMEVTVPDTCIHYVLNTKAASLL